MTSVNLIPVSRYRALARQKRSRAWTIACLAYVVMASSGYAVCYAQWSGTYHGIFERVAKVSDQVIHANKVNDAVRRKTAVIMDAKRISRIFNAVPDWSVVLKLLANILGNDLVLSRCLVERADSSDAITPVVSHKAEPMILSLRGFARSQAAISQFAIRLETVSIFDQVVVMETRRESFNGNVAVAFSIRCMIANGVITQ